MSAIEVGSASAAIHWPKWAGCTEYMGRQKPPDRAPPELLSRYQTRRMRKTGNSAALNESTGQAELGGGGIIPIPGALEIDAISSLAGVNSYETTVLELSK